MEVKLYQEENRTIIVIENGTVDLNKAVFALVQAAVTPIEGVEPAEKQAEAIPQIDPKTEMVSPPETISVETAQRMLSEHKESALISLLNTVRMMPHGKEREDIILACKNFAKGIQDNLPNYSYDDKIKLVQAGWKSQFRGKFNILHATSYATTDEFDNCATENEIDVAAAAFAQLLYQWGTR